MENIKNLIDLLESNGFEPSDDNIQILKENLEDGSTVILDSSNLNLIEGMDEDYLYMQLLDNNGFLINENNLSVIKEAIENGHILLQEGEKADKFKKGLKAVGKGLAITAIGAGLGAAAGAGAGRLADHIGGEKANADVAAANTEMSDLAASEKAVADAGAEVTRLQDEQARLAELEQMKAANKDLSSTDQKWYEEHKGINYAEQIKKATESAGAAKGAHTEKYETSDDSGTTKSEKIKKHKEAATEEQARQNANRENRTGTKTGAVVGTAVGTLGGAAAATAHGLTKSKARKVKDEYHKDYKGAKKLPADETTITKDDVEHKTVFIDDNDGRMYRYEYDPKDSSKLIKKEIHNH